MRPREAPGATQEESGGTNPRLASLKPSPGAAYTQKEYAEAFPSRSRVSFLRWQVTGQPLSPRSRHAKKGPAPRRGLPIAIQMRPFALVLIVLRRVPRDLYSRGPGGGGKGRRMKSRKWWPRTTAPVTAFLSAMSEVRRCRDDRARCERSDRTGADGPIPPSPRLAGQMCYRRRRTYARTERWLMGLPLVVTPAARGFVGYVMTRASRPTMAPRSARRFRSRR